MTREELAAFKPETGLAVLKATVELLADTIDRYDHLEAFAATQPCETPLQGLDQVTEIMVIILRKVLKTIPQDELAGALLKHAEEEECDHFMASLYTAYEVVDSMVCIRALMPANSSEGD